MACATHLAVPSGCVPAAGLDVSVARPVKIAAPDFTTAAVSFTQGTNLVNATDRGGSVPTSPSVYAAIEWSSRVFTPDEYGQSDAAKGGWLWLQLVTLDSTRLTNAGATERLQLFPNEGSVGCLSGMDTAFGYSPHGTDPHAPPGPDNQATPNSFFQSYWGAQLFYADGKDDTSPDYYGKGQDSPGNQLGADATSYSLHEHFEVWQLYLPPGDGSQFVPLQSFTWDWSGKADWQSPNGPWVLTNPANSFTLVPNPTAGTVPFPTWSQLMYAPYIRFAP